MLGRKTGDETSGEKDPVRRLGELIKQGDRSGADAPDELERFVSMVSMVSRVAQIALSAELEGLSITRCLEGWRVHKGGQVFEGFRSQAANQALQAAGLIDQPKGGRDWIPTDEGKRMGIRSAPYKAKGGTGSLYCVYDNHAASWGSKAWGALYKAAKAKKPHS